MLVRSLSTNNRSHHIAWAKVPILPDKLDSSTQIQKRIAQSGHLSNCVKTTTTPMLLFWLRTERVIIYLTMKAKRDFLRKWFRLVSNDIFMITLGRHMDLHYQQLWDIPGICMNALTEGLPWKCWLFSRTFFLKSNRIRSMEAQLCPWFLNGGLGQID